MPRWEPKGKYKEGSSVQLTDRIGGNSDGGSFDTANPPYIRKYLRTYGLTPPRAESYDVQKTRCGWQTRAGESGVVAES
jgi:hypothetical protein